MSGQKYKVLSFEIEKNIFLEKNQSLKIPFAFDSSSCDINTYYGKNVSFSYNLEIQIDVSDSDIAKLDRSLFSKVKSFVTANHTLKYSEYFEVKGLDYHYQIEEAKINFTMQPNLIIGLWCF